MKKNYTILVSIFLLVSSYVLAQPTQPANPASGNASNCTTNAAILTCPQNSSGVQTSFTSGLYNRGNTSNHLGVGAVWQFTNITNISGTQVNAEVTVDAISNATLANSGTGSNTSSTARIEDDGAVDQNNNSIASFFAPRITSISSSSDTRGYVQFTISFFDNTSGGFSHAVTIQNLNFIHLDIDGNGSSSAWFRETGNALSYGSGNPTVVANSPTELVAYNYTDNTTTPGGSFVGYAGSVYERSGVSLCSEVAVAYRYNSVGRASITFRMGYDYKKGNGSNLSATTRQYGATFGCFNFPQEAPLPVKLLSFTGTYRNQTTTLNWQTESEKDFDHYEIERSTNGSDFTSIGTVAAQGNNMTGKQQYQFADDLSATSGNVFYYRLKMVDIDGKSKYSNIVLIRKDEKSINGISIAPNPVVNGIANVRFTSSAGGSVDLRVVDIAGKVVLRQQNQIYAGNNSISVNDLSKLQPGIYTIQISNGDILTAAKFSVIR